MYLFSMANIALHSSLSTLGKEVFSASPLQSGAMMSLSSGVGAAFLIFGMPRILKLLSNRIIVLSTAVLSCVFYFGQVVAPSFLTFTLFEILVSVSNSANTASNKARFSTLFPSDKSGEVFAVVFSLDGINRVVLPIATGLVVQFLTDRAHERMPLQNDDGTLGGFPSVGIERTHTISPTPDQHAEDFSFAGATGAIARVRQLTADALITAVVFSSRMACATAEIMKSIIGDGYRAQEDVLKEQPNLGPLQILSPQFWVTTSDLTRIKNEKEIANQKHKIVAYCSSFLNTHHALDSNDDDDSVADGSLNTETNIESRSFLGDALKWSGIASFGKTNDVEVAIEQRQRISQMITLLLSLLALVAIIRVGV